MAQIQKGTTYSTGDQVTATNLNALADAAILLPGAITDQTAKTVPLAADTVLIHSAADTALRKSTLTQLFANATGIPISTGISGLGTGIATALAVNTGSAGAPVLFNGALGTPTSGTVTNLTGTASININGTVGATTASTGAFTTLTTSDSGYVQATFQRTAGNGPLLFLKNYSSTAFKNWFIGAGYNGEQLEFMPSTVAGGSTVGSTVAAISSTGLAVTGALTATSTNAVFSLTDSARYALFSLISSGTNQSTYLEFKPTGTGKAVIQVNGNDRLAIDSSGNVGIGTTSPAQKLHVNSSSATVSPITTTSVTGDTTYQAILVTKFDNDSTTSQNFIQFQINNGGANCGKITANGANTAAFGSTSDRRVKENIADLPSQLANIMALRPVEFDYIESYGGGHQIGFVAQEMQEVYPDVIAQDASEEKILSITGWSKTEARLVKALQELNANLVAELQSVRQRLAALEAK